jgi:protein involved in polysaccharide export with SLBB domain
MPVRADYKLGTDDRVRIKVHEWRASLGEVHEWKALSDEFTVGPTGAVFLPLVGELRAEGRTPAEVASAISQALRNKAGLQTLPDTSVEVVEFRPFYILGKVAKPGAYPFRPGLTVLQGVSLAGGLNRASELGLLRIDREIMSGRSTLVQLNLGIDGQIARRARLQAELDGADQISFPPELVRRENEPEVSKLLSDERKLFAARREALRSQTETLLSLKEQLNGEVESLKAKVILKERQLELLRREVQSVTTLVKRGLAIESRQFALERAEADAESNRLDLDTAIMRARQEISKTEQAILELQSKYRTGLISDIRATHAKLQEQWEQADLAQKLLYEAEITAADIESERTQSDKVRPIYSIARKVDGTVREFPASEFDAVEPGDIVSVRVPVEADSTRMNAAPRATRLIRDRESGAGARAVVGPEGASIN